MSIFSENHEVVSPFVSLMLQLIQDPRNPEEYTKLVKYLEANYKEVKENGKVTTNYAYIQLPLKAIDIVLQGKRVPGSVPPGYIGSTIPQIYMHLDTTIDNQPVYSYRYEPDVKVRQVLSNSAFNRMFNRVFRIPAELFNELKSYAHED